MKSRLLLFSLVSSLPVSAADFQWDPNGATTGLGGAGTWDTTSLFWDATATGVNDGTDATTATTFTTADKAIFGGTGGAVSVGTAVSLNQLSVDTTGYSFTGSKITFGGTAATLTANADFTIANAIGGNFNKNGSGAVTLTGLTTFNTVTVSAGTLTRAGSGDNDSSASIVNGGTLILANTAANGTSNVTLNSGTVRLNGTNDVQIWNGGTVTINGGTFEQNGKNETVGSLILNGGSITGAGTLTSNSVIDARSGSSATILAGTLGLTKTTAGTVTLSAANTFTGATAIQNGTLSLTSGANRLATTGTIVLGSGTTSGLLELQGVAQTTAGLTTSGTGTTNAVVGGSATLSTLTVNNASDIAYSGGLGGAGTNQNNLALAKSGAGKLTLSGTNTFAGGTTLSAGTLSVDAISRIGTGTLTLSGGTFQYTGSGSETRAGAYNLNSGSVSIDVSSATGNLTLWKTSGTFNQQLTKTGLGTLNFGANADNSGATAVVSGGTLVLNSSANNNVAAVTVNNGGTLRLGTTDGSGATIGADRQVWNGGNITINTGGAWNQNGMNETVSTVRLYGGTISGNGILTSSATIDAQAGSSSTILAGSVGLTKTTAGIVTLSAANTFTGNVLVSAGELQTSATNNVRSLGADNVGRTVTVSSGAILKFLGSDTFGNAGSTPNTSLLISGTVTSVAGKLNTLGNVTLTGGTLSNLGGLGPAYQAYSLAGSVTVNGSAASSISGSGSSTGVHLGTNTSFNVADATGSAAADLTVSVPLVNRNGDLGGAGGLTKSGAGTMTLSAINTYTGNTTVSAGTLEVGGSGQLASGTYAGDISNAGTLSINTTANQTLSGAITGAGSLIKGNTGTLTLSGNSSTYTGTTTVSAGTLLLSGQLGGDASVSSAAILAGGGTIGGNLSFLTGSLFDIATALTGDALSVGGTVTFGSGFGIDDLTGVTWGSVSNGIYTLIDTTSTNFTTAGLDNFGLANAYNLGGGRSAYFDQGSLQLVVIPEPASVLLGGLGLLTLLRRRRN